MSSKISDYYGKGGRLSASPADTLVKSAYEHDCSQAEYLIPDLHVANLAHGIMLTEQGIIPHKPAKILLSELIYLVENSDKPVNVDPIYGDVYNCVDVYLKNKIGDVAGWLHAGRARREAVNLSFLLKSRKSFINVASKLLAVSDSLLELSERQKLTLMSDYTYYHHAQPTTVGHYLLTFLTPIIRDFERGISAYNALDCSPAGSGSVNGSRLPLDKDRMTELMLFGSSSIHCRDAMWQPDIPMQVAAYLSTAMTNLSRMCEEWIVWNSSEFGLITLPDEFCRASVIMPQKKNPYPLAYLRGLSSNVSTLFIEFAMLGKVASGFPDSRTFIYDSLISTLDISAAAFEMLSELIQGVSFDDRKMKQTVESSFGFSTDLADYFIMNGFCDYRTAHNIVGQLVRLMMENDIEPKHLENSMLDDVLRENGLSDVELESSVLSDLMDSQNIVNSRVTKGSASPHELESMFRTLSTQIGEQKTWIEAQRKTLDKVNSSLTSVAKNILEEL